MGKVFNYLKLQWQGLLPFALSFLANYVVVTAILGMGLFHVVSNFSWDEGTFQRGVIVYSLCLSLFVFVWAATGAFRALIANKSAMVWLAYVYFAFSVFRFGRFYWSIVSSITSG
jgi:hypothetical protein